MRDLILEIIDRLYNSLPAWFTTVKLPLANVGSKNAILIGKRSMVGAGLGRLWFDSMVATLFSLLGKSHEDKKTVCFSKHLRLICLTIQCVDLLMDLRTRILDLRKPVGFNCRGVDWNRS